MGAHFSPRLDILRGCRKGGASRATEKRSPAVILSGSEGSAFEFSSHYRFFLRYAQDRLQAPLPKLDA